MARVIWALFQIATWQLTFYAALRYIHMDDELPCEHSCHVKSNDIFFNGIHLCDHWIHHTCLLIYQGLEFVWGILRGTLMT